MLNKILIPLDGSSLSRQILLHVRRLLVRQDAEVMLLQLVPPQPLKGPYVQGREPVSEAAEQLESVCQELTREGAKARTMVREGDPAEGILAVADQVDPALIAMSTHGRSGFGRWVWGSVAERVLRHARHPLFLANPKALGEKDLPRDARFARILVPLDGSEPSAAILPIVEEVARLYESEVTLFYAQPIVIASLQYPAVPFTPTKEDGEKLLAPWRERLEKAGVRAKVDVSFEKAALAILNAAEKGLADLVAMTTHGRSGVSRWALGSVAEKVIRHCACPVLVRRTAGFTEGVPR